MNDVLDNPSFETKQRILRLVVDKILVRDEEITIQHTVPISDVRLWHDHYPEHTPGRFGGDLLPGQDILGVGQARLHIILCQIRMGS